MARLTLLHVVGSILVWTCWTTGMTDGLSLEHRLQQLTDNYMELKGNLAEKDAQLEALKRQQNEMMQSCVENEIRFQDLKEKHEMLVEQVTRHVRGKAHRANVSIGHQSGRAMPTSCQDLSQIGHVLSGLYSVMATEMVQNVYCDFTKLPGDAGFETLIGFADVKSQPTYFYVQTSANFNQTKVPIPFDEEMLNVGGAMNSTSGIFTAPRTGNYFFSASGIAYIPASSSALLYFHIVLYVNGGRIGLAHAFSDELAAEGGQHETFSLSSTLNLQAGDQIWLEIFGMSPGAYMNGNGYTHFNGWLLQENLSASL
ncbi:uncharacterized protein LOC130686840 [Daphnia carinata]|uniref:uncharacterized protein LOC130686840 n=1 Tax=Daphnia carinata TaxID=120202 RepID=UPI0025806145|nr:uncharacterized protein LOC130686840 [Daphnia carinata]